MNNIGRIITDFYCNGYFGRTYDLTWSEIIEEADEYIIIKKPNGVIDFANFQHYDWNDNNEVCNVYCMSSIEKQNLIDSWCDEEN